MPLINEIGLSTKTHLWGNPDLAIEMPSVGFEIGEYNRNPTLE
jgi:hypothetical protein